MASDVMPAEHKPDPGMRTGPYRVVRAGYAKRGRVWISKR